MHVKTEEKAKEEIENTLKKLEKTIYPLTYQRPMALKE